ncbi:MAG: beta galactosidase jelly roll domain-containing protein [Muribaculaceae bacterium]|nr:beta galactosidase jelly roll domain-containing protein [Muribaculaceae bacterium]
MKIRCFATAVALSAVCVALASSPDAGTRPLIQNAHARDALSLDGQWKIIVDPYENGYYDYRLNPTDEGYAQDRDYTDRTRLQEYEFETDRSLNVPGDWNTQMPELYYYEGTVWYRKRFNYTPEASCRQFLHFDGANYNTIVWLNGRRLGNHRGGFTGFTFEVTDLLNDGENSVVVKVDNKREPEGVPTVNSDWWNYGGITRSVNLLETPATFISDYTLHLADTPNGGLSGCITLDGDDKASREFTVTIPELKATVSGVTDADGHAEFSLKARPELWSPESPRLYDVTFAIDGDDVADRIGFRTIATDGTRLLLNGKEIFCRGISIHEEAPFTNGRAWNRDQAETLLDWAADLGCNFVRLAHYPHNEHMVRAAEERGMLVWSEIPVYWTIHWDDADTYANAERQLSDMIARDRNRCAVVVWSIANETPVSDARNRFLGSLADKARALDGTRLIGAAMEKREVSPGVMTVDDPLSDIIDLVSFNEYVGWYDGTNEKCDRVSWTFDVKKPVFISEFGGGARYGCHGDTTTLFTEENQEDLYRRHTAMLDRIPGLAGCTPWILKDFRSPRRQLRGIQDDFNRKGLVSEQGQKKKAYYVLRDWYARKRAAHTQR